MNTAIGVTRAFGGISSRAQLLRHGAAGSDIVAAVEGGGLRRLRRGYYATPDARSQACTAVAIGGRLAGVSSAATYGLWSGINPGVHIAVAPNASRLRRRRSDPGVAIHWVEAAPAEMVWRVTREDTLRQVVRWSDPETAIACLDSALTEFGWTLARVVELFSQRPAADRAVAMRARVGSGSGCESIVRQRLETIGVSVEQQVPIRGVGFVDMVVRGSRVVIEVDGFEHHGTRMAFEEDRRRDAELARRGYVVVRLTYRRIMGDWEWCRGAVLHALARFPPL